uniref:Polymerase (DNA directed) nu n=1 Tax=Neolamprologus brichardi TaxID=32507 RepID=A0A3Q4MBF9_NEOBR
MERVVPVRTIEDTTVKSHLNSLDIRDDFVDSGTKRGTRGENEENGLEYIVSASEVKTEHFLDTENKATTVEHENPQKISISLGSGLQDVSHCNTEKPQNKGQIGTNTAENDHTQEQPEARSVSLQDNSAENIEKTEVMEPPRSSQEKPREGRVRESKSAREPQGKASPSHETRAVSGACTQLDASNPTQQNRQNKMEKLSRELPGKASIHPPLSKPRKPKQAACETNPTTSGPKGFQKLVKNSEPPTQSKAGCLAASLTCDSRVKYSGKLKPDEKVQMLEIAGQAKVLVLTMVYQDGSTQLDAEQKLTPPACGLLILMKNELDCSTPEGVLDPNDTLVYLKLEHTPAWAQQQVHQSQELFTRSCLIVQQEYLKDLLRTVLQFYRQDLSWKQAFQSLSPFFLLQLLQLQDLHPLPKIILDYRQVWHVHYYYESSSPLKTGRSLLSSVEISFIFVSLRVRKDYPGYVHWPKSQITNHCRKRLSGILGVSSEQASQFQDRFLQTYRDVQGFIQRTIQQSHKQGYVLSIMGRRRNLPNINSPDWAIRMQAERQAVNFVVQASLYISPVKSAFKLLIAQLHDELLYEVEDSHVKKNSFHQPLTIKKKVQVKFYLNKGQSNSFSTLLFL